MVAIAFFIIGLLRIKESKDSSLPQTCRKLLTGMDYNHL